MEVGLLGRGESIALLIKHHTCSAKQQHCYQHHHPLPWFLLICYFSKADSGISISLFEDRHHGRYKDNKYTRKCHPVNYHKQCNQGEIHSHHDMGYSIRVLLLTQNIVPNLTDKVFFHNVSSR